MMENNSAVTRITAIWALCESGLGGILHAMQIPFKGGVLCFLSILCIGLIAQLSDKPRTSIFKALVVVLLIKAMISPHSPITAYLAVAFQGVIGAVLLGQSLSFAIQWIFILLVYLETASQKLLTLWLFFGNKFWTALDEFGNWILSLLHFSGSGFWVPLGLYYFIYAVFAFLACWLVPGLIKDISSEVNSPSVHLSEQNMNFKDDINSSRKRKKWWFPVLVGLLIVITIYFSQGLDSAFYVLIRSILVIYFWFVWLGPWLSQLMVSWLKTKKTNEHSRNVQSILQFFPVMKQVIRNNYQLKKKLRISYRQFIVMTFAQIINYRTD